MTVGHASDKGQTEQQINKVFKYADYNVKKLKHKLPPMINNGHDNTNGDNCQDRNSYKGRKITKHSSDRNQSTGNSGYHKNQILEKRDNKIDNYFYKFGYALKKLYHFLCLLFRDLPPLVELVVELVVYLNNPKRIEISTITYPAV